MKTISKAQQRVAIARDAIKQINGDIYKPTCMIWVNGILKVDNDLLDGDGGKQQLQPILVESQPKCMVCARGALLLSMVRKYNSYTLADLRRGNEGQLRKLFGNRQIEQMEAAFERWEETNQGYSAKRSQAFGSNYATDKDRLIAILKNIIKNNGTFKP